MNIIRVGTSGAVQEDIPIGSIMVSEYGIGLDAMILYYLHQLSGDEHMILDAVKLHFHHFKGISHYITAADPDLIENIGKDLKHGITVTAIGSLSLICKCDTGQQAEV